MKEKLAIIGSGIAGLSTAYFAQSQYHITLFEKNDYLGGHANTRFVNTLKGPIPVDTGFIVYNELTYPNLTNLFKEIEVNTVESDMSFSFNNPIQSFEYGGGSLGSLIGDKSNLIKPTFYVMLKDIFRFYKNFQKKLPNETITVGEYCKEKNFSEEFIKYHLLPLISSIWSTPNNLSMNQPLINIVSFFQNHKLFNFINRPKWKSILGGSREYIKKIISLTNMDIKLSANIDKIELKNKKIIIHNNGTFNEFDKIVFSAPPNMFSHLSTHWSNEEHDIFDNFNFQSNLVQLHQNTSTMPRYQKTWSSWNFYNDEHSCSLTYWMNLLQKLDTDQNIFVSLNQHFKDKISYQTSYDHPIFNNKSLDSQKQIGKIQGKNNFYYTGSYLGYGFHEDGIQSAIKVCQRLNIDFKKNFNNPITSRILWN